ncbi:hypothetical protein Q5P01_025610 [Channa striata]|uniref:Osteoclast-stimulating factor 1 n=1 Tax=Channa striata TaxID=64152 RepID=A0AA88J281_CHASR|nr:hypothetical protein Q5P01_025610 [Channa striata]
MVLLRLSTPTRECNTAFTSPVLVPSTCSQTVGWQRECVTFIFLLQTGATTHKSSMEATGKYDFKASTDDELSFRKGESLKILQTTGNWYKAEIDGVEGFVPKNFLHVNLPSWYQENASRNDSEEKLMSQALGAFLIRASKSAAPGNFSLSVRHTRDVQHFKVLRHKAGQYSVWSERFSSLNQLVDHYKNNSVSKNSNVLLVETLQKVGTAPPTLDIYTVPEVETVSHLSRLLQSPATHLYLHHDRYSAIVCVCHKTPSTLQVRALYTFRAEEADELGFNAGDVIKVLECSDEAWWKGQLRGKTGLFPTNYTIPM